MNSKKSVFKWLTITLLLLLSAFCYALYAKIPKTLSPPDVQASEPPAPTDVTEPSVVLPEPEPEQQTVYSSFPKAANLIGDSLVLNVGGADREALSAVHNLGDNTYILFETASDSYDVTADFRCVAVALVDKNLNLSTVVALGNMEERYLSSKVNPDGITVVTAGDGFISVYKLAFSLSVLSSVRLDAADSVKLYFANNNTYLFASTADKLSVKVLSAGLEVIGSFSTVADGKVYEVFPTAGGLSAFIGGDNCYGVISFDYTLGFTSKNVNYDYSLVCVYPTLSDNELAFTALLKGNNGYTVALTDRNAVAIRTAEIGSFDACFMLPIGENFWLYASGDTVRTMLFCKHLDKIIDKGTSLMLSDITFFENRGDRLLVNAVTVENELLVCETGGEGLMIKGAYTAARGISYVDSAGNLYLCTAVKSGLFKHNFGNADVFIIKGGLSV